MPLPLKNDILVPQPYNAASERLKKAFRRVQKASGSWPWELFGEQNPPKWGESLTENLALLLDKVRDEMVSVTLEQLVDHLRLKATEDRKGVLTHIIVVDAKGWLAHQGGKRASINDNQIPIEVHDIDANDEDESEHEMHTPIQTLTPNKRCPPDTFLNQNPVTKRHRTDTELASPAEGYRSDHIPSGESPRAQTTLSPSEIQSRIDATRHRLQDFRNTQSQMEQELQDIDLDFLKKTLNDATDHHDMALSKLEEYTKVLAALQDLVSLPVPRGVIESIPEAERNCHNANQMAENAKLELEKAQKRLDQSTDREAGLRAGIKLLKDRVVSCEKEIQNNAKQREATLLLSSMARLGVEAVMQLPLDKIQTLRGQVEEMVAKERG